MMHPAMKELGQLPVAQRMELAQQLWDSIKESKEEMPIPQWHIELAQARLASIQDGDLEQGLTREEVWRQVDELSGLDSAEQGPP